MPSPSRCVARYALARAIREHAWSLRGADIAARTDPQAMLAFMQQLAKADKLLKEADGMGEALGTHLCRLD